MIEEAHEMAKRQREADEVKRKQFREETESYRKLN